MHFVKVILALSLILGVAFATFLSRENELKGDDLAAAKEILIKALDKLPDPKYSVIQWLSARSGSIHKFVVDVTDGSNRNECTFEVLQSLPIVENGSQIDMRCQGGYRQSCIW